MNPTRKAYNRFRLCAFFIGFSSDSLDKTIINHRLKRQTSNRLNLAHGLYPGNLKKFA